MGLEIWLDDDSHPGIDVSGLSTGISQGLCAKDLVSQFVLVGSSMVRAGDVFRIVDFADNGDRVDCRGDWSRVNHVAADLTAGEIGVHSSVGSGAGRRMCGGSIRIQGDAADDLGQSMRGGRILVDGKAGDRIGGPESGATAGMNRGSIVVRGDCGNHAGMRMRRGSLVVGGNCGELAGYEMRGGNLIIAGQSGELAGHGMRRGTIVLLNQPASIDAGFRRSGSFDNPFHRLLGRSAEWTMLKSGRWPDQFELWAGDLLYGSKGELAIGQVTKQQ